MFPKERHITVENILDFSTFPTEFTFHNTTSPTLETVEITTTLAGDKDNPYVVPTKNISTIFAKKDTYIILGIEGIEDGQTLKVINVDTGEKDIVNLHRTNIVNSYYNPNGYSPIFAAQIHVFVAYQNKWIMGIL